MEMRRSKGIVTGVVATGMMAAVPAAAQAPQVSGGDAQCTLIGNVPTITASARFESFADNDKPIRGELQVDGASVETITDFTFSGPSGTWNSAQHRVAAGPHHVSGSFTRPNQDGASGRFSAEGNRRAAEPPPPPSNPSTSPSPAPAPPAAGQPAPQPQGAVLGESGRCVPRKL